MMIQYNKIPASVQRMLSRPASHSTENSVYFLHERNA